MRAGLKSGIRWLCRAASKSAPVLLLWLVLPAPPAHAAELAGTPAVCVAVDSQNAPFMFVRGGVAEGLYPQLVRAAFQQMDTAVKLEAIPWSRALRQLDQAECGVAGIYRNAERLQKYDFSAAIFIERVRLYARRERGLSFAGIADLAGLRVGVIRGWSYGDAFDQARRTGQVTVEEVPADAQNFGKLASGRLDAVLAVEQAGAALLAGGAYPSVQVLPRPLAVNSTHLAFHKSTHSAALLKRFDAAMDHLRRDGTHDRLVVQVLLTQ
jgi:polar amino acid transport system substrate-binding protein